MGRVYSVDGPAGAGKDTAAAAAGREINFTPVDSGGMYRLLTVHFRKQCDDLATFTYLPKEEHRVQKILDNMKVSIESIGGKSAWFINEEEIYDEELRTNEIAISTSLFSPIPAVRAKVDAILTELPHHKDVIVCGRDIGSKVFPNAEEKFYITASPEKRAERRFLEQKKKGEQLPYEQILQDILKRDHNDMNRAVSPLVVPKGATYIDTTDMTIEETAQIIIDKHKKRYL